MPLGIGFSEMLLIFAALLLLFGAKRLPELAQGMGKGIRDFKRALNGLDDESIQGGQSQGQSISGGQSQSPSQSIQTNQPPAAPRVQAPVETESQKVGD